ncbi:Transthyretin-like protein 46 [Toxocara canis]|uniref:Transthyretin-like protein 46 n=1 Tax=Toxocara canis TaxID=6265 RepID=A0A0B2UYV1_TOXCA|nr:Transthyretin-like protein 46 [Toxocara canis]
MRTQTVGVRGTLLCGGEPLTDADLKLWDEDTGPDPDDLMAVGRTSAEGKFELKGTEIELTNIDPKLKVYHNCNNKWPCKRKTVFTISDKYIHAGREIDKWFELGVLNMETIFDGEEHKCL